MTFGITDSGFTLKRLPDILTELRNEASVIFKDLVEPGEIVDTSDSSTIGRFINLFAVPAAQIWEELQLCYSSFDPNTALNIPLDNIVQYGGISRLAPTNSTCTALFIGDNGVLIDAGTEIGSDSSPNTFLTSSSVALTPSSCSGVVLSVSSVENSSSYTITYTIGSISSSTVTYTSDSDATESEILNGIKTEIDSSHPYLVASIDDTSLIIEKSEYSQLSDFTTSNNISLDKVYKLGLLIASEVGPISAPANSLTVILSPVIGWDSVANISDTILGSFEETDEELRLRFRNTKFERSSNILDSLYSALTSIENVTNVAIYENNTDSTDSNDIPEHSFEVVILGGEDGNIADTIWNNKPIGISSVGDVSVDIIDSQGFNHEIKFSRPTPVIIYISIDISTDEYFPEDGEDKIRSEILSYAVDNFSVGDDIVYSRLYTPINQVQGHQVNSLLIGTSPSPSGTSNISISFDEIGSFNTVNISITST